MSETTTTTPIIDEIRRDAKNDDRIGRSSDLLKTAINNYRSRNREVLDLAESIKTGMDTIIQRVNNGWWCDNDMICQTRDMLQRALIRRTEAIDQIRQMCWVHGIDAEALFEEIGSL